MASVIELKFCEFGTGDVQIFRGKDPLFAFQPYFLLNTIRDVQSVVVWERLPELTYMKHRPIKAGNLFLRCSQGNGRLLARQEADDGVEEQEQEQEEEQEEEKAHPLLPGLT